MKIESIDQNFCPKSTLNQKDIVWHDVRKEPFRIYGLYEPQRESPFRRMPETVAASVSKRVVSLALHTAGGRIRFCTDSPFVALSADLPEKNFMVHMTAIGTYGFDMYIGPCGKERFQASFQPRTTVDGNFSDYQDISPNFGEGEHIITVNFPLYNAVENVHIGLKEGSTLTPAPDYRNLAPFVYYGSSITQGGCASRPGISYESAICRRFGIDYLNLGLAGCAHAEQVMADYLAGLDMSIFICDYDHNAPDAKELEATHFNLYQTIRKRHKNVPYIMISRPDVFGRREESLFRRKVIEKSFEAAIAAGDKNVYYIDGSTLFAGPNADECTVDSMHPNDLGFYRMSRVIGDKIEEILRSSFQ